MPESTRTPQSHDLTSSVRMSQTHCEEGSKMVEPQSQQNSKSRQLRDGARESMQPVAKVSSSKASFVILTSNQLRTISKYILRSPQRRQIFLETSKAAGLSTDDQVLPIKDVPTRWNWTLSMIERACRIRMVSHFLYSNPTLRLARDWTCSPFGTVHASG